MAIQLDLLGFEIYCHKNGNLRFAVWNKGKEVCWCRTLEQAAEIVRALDEKEAQ
jgi:hypothetical protein